MFNEHIIIAVIIAIALSVFSLIVAYTRDGGNSSQFFSSTFQNVKNGDAISDNTTISVITEAGDYKLGACSAPGGEYKIVTNNIKKSGWSVLDTTHTYSDITDISIVPNTEKIIVATNENIQMFDNGIWTVLGVVDGGNNEVKLSTVSETSIYVTGVTGMDGNPGGFFHWDGTTWTALLNDGFTTAVDMAVIGANIYIVGSFTDANNIPNADGIAMYNGTNWSTVGATTGLTDVDCIMVHTNGDIYIGGRFKTIGSVNASCIGRYDGTTWHQLSMYPSEPDAFITRILQNNNDLYIAGHFNVLSDNVQNEIQTGNIAHFNGTSWSNMNNGLQGDCSEVAFDGTYIYAGGDFVTSSEGYIVNHIARWDGQTWTNLQNGLDSPVFHIYKHDGHLAATEKRNINIWELGAKNVTCSFNNTISPILTDETLRFMCIPDEIDNYKWANVQ